jgi:DNA repair photolyase
MSSPIFSYENFLKDFAGLLARKIFCVKSRIVTTRRSGTATKIFSGERKVRMTRCREVLAKFPNPVATIMKNRLVTRDIDLLRELAKHKLVAVNLP